ncbi:hypothetical protein SASPL_122357 [Salvia splendens]|uniref:UBP-type domain-containing protein n=1 Tax=Salvia splendens TaxID=180675 RepID=A0A8X8ZSX0_SALSN|nr:hypothetical protein SASPL_122357 [Salvia splendens]
MAQQSSSSSSSSVMMVELDDGFLLDGSESGWVEARIHCDHLASLSSDLLHIPTPDTPCHRCRKMFVMVGDKMMGNIFKRCQHPNENWLCLCCKDVLCSRFVNKHMLEHYQQTNHNLALSYSDLSVWCFSCDTYLNAQVMQPLHAAYETAYILKFGSAPPYRAIERVQTVGTEANASTGN